MLITSSKLLNTPVMSLHVGGRVANTKHPIINPNNLRIVAFEVVSPAFRVQNFLLADDIREFGPLGMIINDTDELVLEGDVIRLDEIRKLHFTLTGMNVRDEDGKKIGKVSDYTVETDRFEIQQLSVQRGILKSFSDTGLLVHRSQIVEVSDSTIIIKTTKTKLTQPIAQQDRTAFVNPFRAPGQTPQPESSSVTSP